MRRIMIVVVSTTIFANGSWAQYSSKWRGSGYSRSNPTLSKELTGSTRMLDPNAVARARTAVDATFRNKTFSVGYLYDSRTRSVKAHPWSTYVLAEDDPALDAARKEGYLPGNNRTDFTRAINDYQFSFAQWLESEPSKKSPTEDQRRQALSNLARSRANAQGRRAAPRISDTPSRRRTYPPPSTPESSDTSGNSPALRKVLRDNRTIQRTISATALPKLIQAAQAYQNSQNITDKRWAAIGKTLSILKTLQEEESAMVQKAVYTYDSPAVFDPNHYKKLLRNAASVGRIVDQGTKELRGSCFYVGEGLFLSASHVLNGNATKYGVEFTTQDFSKLHEPLKFTIVKDWKKSNKSSATNSDVVLCRIESQDYREMSLHAVAPDEDFINTPIPFGTPVYVVGFPKMSDRVSATGIAIHDDSEIVLPFKVPNAEINALFMQMTLTNIWLENCSQAMGDLSTEVLRLQKLFKDMYGYDAGSDSPGEPFYFAKMGGSVIMGIESDTFPGDSGAPVFRKVDGKLVGVFTGGVIRKDGETAKLPQATVEFYEWATPINLVWEHVREELNKEI